MNVYVAHTVQALVAAGHRVDVITADPTFDTPGTTELGPHLAIHQLPAPAATKEALAGKMPELVALLADHPAMARAETIWAHYWISADAALHWRQDHTAATGEPGPPVLVSMHTIGAVKDRDTGRSDELPQRLAAESHIAASADLLVANTGREAADMIEVLGADPSRIVVAAPGVDTTVFSPGDKRAARSRLGLAAEEHIVLYVGRMQYIKGTDVAIAALAEFHRTVDALTRSTRTLFIGAASGNHDTAEFQASLLAAGLGEVVEILDPVPADVLADYYRAADVLIMPSRSESFGLAAAEAVSTGLPVIAAAVGGLPDIVTPEVAGRLVPGHDPHDWAVALRAELTEPSTTAPPERPLTWENTVARVLGALAVRTGE